MGGHALKTVVTRRYARAEYYALKERILNQLRPHIERIDVPKEFPAKESFGDLDVLIVCPSSINCKQLIIDLFHPNEIVQNGNVYSFDLEEFQIDFILIPEDQFENSVVYFSYSDLGGLIGNVCHKIGLKYGMQGLWMNVHTKESDPTTASTQLILSRNSKEIFTFLGYDYERYLKGFSDENQFFQWIIEGKYFRRFYFEDDQLNHAHRHRTAKRPIYIKFIAYLNQIGLPRGELDESERDFVQNVRQQAVIFFDKQNEYQRGFHIRDDRHKLKEKYNGRVFVDLAENRQMIRVLKEQFERRIAPTDDEFQQWVIDTDPEMIKEEIEKFKTEIKKQ